MGTKKEWEGALLRFRAWQQGVLRFLEHLERMQSHLPVPTLAGVQSLAILPPRVASLGIREAEVEMLETPTGVYLTLEVAGAAKEEIDLTVTEETLSVEVDTPRCRYYREIGLPGDLNLESVEASYRNGVLDVMFERRGRR